MVHDGVAGGFAGTKIKSASPKQAFVYMRIPVMANSDFERVYRRRKMINWTWLKLHSDCHFYPFFAGLKEYLRSKLQVIKIDGFSYYSCGAEYHHDSIPTWKPFEHFEEILS